MILNVYCSVIRVMRVLTKWLRQESRGFRVQYLSSLRIKFDDQTKGNPSNFKHLSDLFASKVKLTSLFGVICSQISQLLRLVTQICGNQRTFDK